MVQIGGHEATLRDFEIPARYGVRQTIADTLGIGGIFRTLRTAEHMLALGHELAELCPPEAWLLNYTNPMAALCELVYKGTPTKNVVGLCHSVQNTIEDLCELVERARGARSRSSSAGINHQAFFLRFERDGREPLPAARRADRRPTPSCSAACASRSTAVSASSRPSRASTRPSTCRGSWRTTDEIEHYRIPVDEYISRSEANLEEYARVKGALGRRRGDRRSSARTSTPR